ncbi:MAG TPA: LuxR C-terminal-related transcriptional regulator [Gaiellaceae bacterium]|nr:LuxR C-terminal-related transcriptional regulator [Gaiellaceae bacterium]
MVETITATASPALDHIIERPRLIARIVDGDARVTVFAAAAGYGKTTLARQWAERQTGPVAWYQTTRASGDVAALAVEMDELLASIAPDLPRDPGRVARIASVNPSPRPLGRALLQTYEPLTQDVLVIVDEWEAAGTDEAEQLLSTLVDGLAVRFLITTRTRPAWFTPRLEVYGEGLEIGMDELAMTDQEAADVLFYIRNKETSASVLALASGWPAVLGLAAFTTKRAGEAEQMNPLPAALHEYLATEVIFSAEPSVREAAMLVAAAAVSDVDTARVILGADANVRLAQAQSHGLLAIDAGRVSMHPLIANALVVALCSADEVRSQVAGLAEVVVERRLWGEAQALAERAPDASFISSVLAAALPELTRTGRLTSMRWWVKTGLAAGADPSLLDYAEAELSLREGETVRAYGLAERAAKALEGDVAARAHLVAARAAHLRDRPATTMKQARAAAGLARSDEAREGAAWLQFLSALEEQDEGLEDALGVFEQIARSGLDQSLTLATGQLCIAEIEGGLTAALDEAATALTLVQGDVDPMAYTGLLSTQSYALVMAARYEKSLEAAEALATVADTYELEFASRYATFNKAAALIGIRRFGSADRLLSSLEKTTRDEAGTYFGGNIAIQRARLYASVGQVERALDVLSLGPSRDWIRAARGEFLGLRALLLAATGAVPEAVTQVEMARTVSRGLETRALACLAEATVLLASKRHDEADPLLDEAIETETLDPLVIALRAVPALASYVAQQAKWQGLLLRLLTGSVDVSLARALGIRIPRAVRPRQVLSPREAEVHELIAEGLTNEEISKLLYISISTTKVHVKHILEKLGARSRVEAARLLDDS